MTDKIVIGCRLPNGLNFLLREDGTPPTSPTYKEKVHIKGSYDDEVFSLMYPGKSKKEMEPVLHSTHCGITYIDKDKWEKIKKDYKIFVDKNIGKSLIEGKSEKEVKAQLKDILTGNFKTGFDPAKKPGNGSVGDLGIIKSPIIVN